MITLSRIAIMSSKTASAKPVAAKALVEHRSARTRTRLPLYYGELWLPGCATLPEICQHMGMSRHQHEAHSETRNPSGCPTDFRAEHLIAFLTVSPEISFLDLEGQPSASQTQDETLDVLETLHGPQPLSHSPLLVLRTSGTVLLLPLN